MIFLFDFIFLNENFNFISNKFDFKKSTISFFEKFLFRLFFKAFYIIFEYGDIKTDKEFNVKYFRMFDTPFESMFSMFILSLNQIEDIYKFSLYSSYAVVAKVKKTEY